MRGKKTKALVFTVVTKQPANNSNGSSDSEGEGITSFVPAVVFNPPPELEQTLTTTGKGLLVEFQGRVNASRNETSDEPRSNADVVVYTRTLRIMR